MEGHILADYLEDALDAFQVACRAVGPVGATQTKHQIARTPHRISARGVIVYAALSL